jgi:hypothetical protein
MPAKAGIQVRSRSKFKNRLDSGFRRKDGIRVDFRSTNSRTPRLGAEGRSVSYFGALGAHRRHFTQWCIASDERSHDN